MDYDGPAVSTGLNLVFVIEPLNHTNAHTVQMAPQGAHRNALFKLPAQPDFAYVVSPMRLSAPKPAAAAAPPPPPQSPRAPCR